MTKTRFPFGDIKSYTPAIDARNTTDVFVLEGRNFLWDSKGPKSGFGTRLLALGEVIEDAGGIAQSIEIGTRCITFTNRGAYQLSEDLLSWTQILDLAPYAPVTDPELDKWTAAYLSKGIYFAHPEYGMFKLAGNSMIPMDNTTTPGLPFWPQAVAETNGRLIVLGVKHVGWSAPSEAEDFEPTLGGAGQVLLSDRVTGKPVTLAAFQLGFLVWTDKDCLLGEFIGGNNVFRFDRLTTKQIPLSAHTVDTLPDGSQLICTKQGVYRIENGREPEAVTPIFNEFFRKVLEHEPGIHVRFTYVLEADLLYVQLRDWTNHYVRTYVLSLALDKWGLFSERHLGIIRWSTKRGSSGYVDSKGVAHKFVETFNREITPHVFQGLDSSITLGYVKPPELHGKGGGEGEIDSLLEMQEIFIGSRPARPSWSQAEIIDMGDLPVPMTADLNFVTQTYLIQGGEQLIADNFGVMFNPDYIDEFGLDTRDNPVALEQNAPQAIGSLEEVVVNNLYSTGVTFIFECDIIREGTIPFLCLAGEDPFNPPSLVEMIYQMSSSGEAFAEDDWDMGISTGVVDWEKYGINKWGITLNKPLGGGLWRSAVSMNGGAAVFQDVNYDFAEMLPILNEISIGAIERYNIYSAGLTTGSSTIVATRDSRIRRIQVMPAVSEAQLAVLTDVIRDPVQFVGAGDCDVGNATTRSMPIPDGVQIGDRLIAFVLHRSPVTPPAGWSLVTTLDHEWTTLVTLLNYVQHQSVYTKVSTVAGGVGTEEDWEQEVSDRFSVHIMGFRKNGGTVAINTSLTNIEEVGGPAETELTPFYVSEKHEQMAAISHDWILSTSAAMPQGPTTVLSHLTYAQAHPSVWREGVMLTPDSGAQLRLATGYLRLERRQYTGKEAPQLTTTFTPNNPNHGSSESAVDDETAEGGINTGHSHGYIVVILE